MALSSNPYFTFNLIVFFIAPILQIAVSQSNSPPPPSPADSCNGIFVSYAYTSGSKIRPFLAAPARQPYRFESTITVLNNGLDELKSWRVFVGFKHNEYLVSASSAVLADGNSLPGNVGNGTVFSGYPSSDLMSAVETAGDVTQMQAQIDLVGTVFGVGPPSVPMPSNISLANDGFKCPKPTMQGKNQMQVCCVKDANSTSNVIKAEKFLPRQNGDLTIMYDVLRTYESNYYAQVTIENQNTLGRLDNWRLSWQWMRDEFIFAMQGAYPSVVDYSNCIFGPQGQYYKALDFSTILNCERRPTIIDLPPTKYNDTKLGLKPSCCRNGTILPRWMDPSKSISIFQLNVYKMPPDLNSSELNPPQNFQISGTLNPDYACGPPIRVTPSQFPDPSGLPLNSTAISSWQVVCNITQPKKASPKCCVSFSAYYNESVVPCKTCACGGCQNNKAKTCSATAPAILLPPEALLVPFENRTAMAVAWAGLKHRTVPNPLPCADNCGVSINWHLYTDFNKGWSARVTLFNWGDVNFADWFAAVQMDKAAAGFERMYSFNGSIVEDVDKTIFMQGLTGLNYLVAETDGINSSNGLRVPGKQQSVISFTKKGITGINVAGGDGFPKKVFFNGEECSLPSIYPVSSGPRKSSTLAAISVLTALFILLIQK